MQCQCVYIRLFIQGVLKLTADCVHHFLFPAHISNQFSEMDLTADPVMACISVRCATRVLVTTSIWWCTIGHTQENVHMYVMSVGSVSRSLVTLRLTLLFIRVNVHICVKNVAGVLDELHTYKNMLFCTQGRDLMCALSAPRHLYVWLIWRTILLYTPWTGHMSANCAPRLLQHQLDYEDIATHTRVLRDSTLVMLTHSPGQ